MKQHPQKKQQKHLYTFYKGRILLSCQYHHLLPKKEIKAPTAVAHRQYGKAEEIVGDNISLFVRTTYTK